MRSKRVCRAVSGAGWRGRGVLFASVVLLLASCAPNAPAAEREISLDLPVPSNFAAGQDASGLLVDDLKGLFNDKKLNALVDTALANNLEVRLAAQKMQLAGYSAGIAGAGLAPTVGASVNGSRSGRNSTTSEQTTTGLDVSWELDLWGKLRDQRGAARADARAAKAQLADVRSSIAAQVMQGWFTYVSAHQAIGIEKQRLGVLRRSRDFIQQNYQSGIGSQEDLAATERDIALAQADILAREGDLNDAARSLEILLGQYPDGVIPGTPRFPKLPKAPKAGVPADILIARPDMRSAYAAVEAADRRVKVSQKELLPSIALTGSLGGSSGELGNLLSAATIWSLAGNLTTPIFQGGRLKTEILASRNRADQAWVAYLQTALTAFSEVERALDQETRLRRRASRLYEAEKQAAITAELFASRYQAGLVTILEDLNAQNALFDIRAQLLAVKTARLSNRVALSLALGKGI